MFPLEIENIILDYKYQLELTEKYDKCMYELLDTVIIIAERKDFKVIQINKYTYYQYIDFGGYSGYLLRTEKRINSYRHKFNYMYKSISYFTDKGIIKRHVLIQPEYLNIY